MKLFDDEKMREKNGIQDDIGRNKLELKKTSCDDGNMVKIILVEETEGKNIVSNGHQTQSKKDGSDGLTSEKKVKEDNRKYDGDINVNTVNKEPKVMRQLTEELTKLRFDCKKSMNIRQKEADMKRDKPKSLDQSNSFDGEDANNADSKGPVDDITSGMEEMVLKSKFKERSKQTDNIVLIAKKVEIPGNMAYGAKNEEVKEKSEGKNGEKKTVVIVAPPEKKGEENEDCAATLLLSDANFDPDCVSLEFVGRGPLYGIPKSNGSEDSGVYAQPRKFSRPTGYYPYMSGGYVQEIPSTQPTFFDRNNYVEVLNIPSTNHPCEKTYQPGFMPSISEMNRMSGHPFDSNPRFSQFDWLMNSQPSTFYGLGNEVLSSGDVAGDLDGFLFSHRLMNPAALDEYGYPEPTSPNGSYINTQLPIHSPHDQVLSSPGSSPPSFVNSPYNAFSLLPADCDIASMSPSSYATLSPESGIVGDLTEEATRDLEIALEYIEEHAGDEMAAKKTPPLPELIEALNTGLDPISGTVLSSSRNACPAVVSVSRPCSKGARKSASKPIKSKQVVQILPPVTGGDGVLPGAVFPPPGINVNLLPTNFQLPCVFIEPSGKCNKQPAHTKPRKIQPKPSASNSMSPTTSSQTPQSNVHTNVLPTFTLPSNTPSPSQESTVTSSSEQDQLVKAYRWVAGLPKEKLLVQDDDGDTILHLTIVKEEKKLVKALLERYVREELIDKVINLANKQHQTPLCLAVFLNQTDIVRMLIEQKADVNVQLQRKLNCGLMCYQLIHYAAKRGQKWIPTLIQLLGAKNIDLHAFDSDGCTAMHCAIKDHGEARPGSEKINSKDTIYHLATHGADLNYQHGLSGKTPLHYVIEKKDGDLVGWFLGLAMHVQSSRATVSSSGSTTENPLYSILNAKPSGGITALQLALNLQMDQEERVKILELLLKHGAEVSQKSCDGKLRQELGKYPKLAPLLKNGTSSSKNM